ncbi:Uncharacterised protein [Elizabethkingia anophelis]|nr:Uncharacterised protein [Elizabethkingia anophelis]
MHTIYVSGSKKLIVLFFINNPLNIIFEDYKIITEKIHNGI